MKNTNLVRIFLVALISIMLVMVSTSVFAADSTNGLIDLSNTLTTNNTSNTSNTSNTTNTTNTNTSLTTNTNTSRTNNTSVYNSTNTNLPKTGVETSIPVAMVVVISAISAIYAYKKINDYKNV